MIKQWVELPRGCGKSTLLQEIIEEKIAEGKRCVLISPFIERRYKPSERLIQIRTVKLARGYGRRNTLYYVDDWDRFSSGDQRWMTDNLTVEVATRSVNRDVYPETWFGQLRLITAKLWLTDIRKKLGRDP